MLVPMNHADPALDIAERVRLLEPHLRPSPQIVSRVRTAGRELIELKGGWWEGLIQIGGKQTLHTYWRATVKTDDMKVLERSGETVTRADAEGVARRAIADMSVTLAEERSKALALLRAPKSGFRSWAVRTLARILKALRIAS